MTSFTQALFQMVELEGHCQIAKASLALGNTKQFLESLNKLEDKLQDFKLKFLTLTDVKTEFFLAIADETTIKVEVKSNTP